MNLWIWRERRASTPSAIIHSTRVRGSRVALSVVRKRAGCLREGWAEEDAADLRGEVVLGDEGAGEVVVGAVGEDELDFVVLREGGEVLQAEAVGGRAGSRALDVDDLVDGFGDEVEGALAGGLDHEGVAAGEELVHEREEFAGLEHGFAAGKLDRACRGRGLRFAR